jgi:hypothetical protein
MVKSRAGSSGIGRWPSSVSRSFPSSPDRTIRCSSSVEPYRDEPSHQCVTSLIDVTGPSASAGRDGSFLIRGMRIGSSCQSSPGGSGMSTSRDVSPSPWVNQSWIMNCSQAAARVLTLVAGRKGDRVSSRRLTSRGLGSISSSEVTGRTWSSGMLRPKRAPAMPMVGWSRSLCEPSTLRLTMCCRVRGGAVGPFTIGTTVDGSCRFFCRRMLRTPIRTARPHGSFSLSQPRLSSTACEIPL